MIHVDALPHIVLLLISWALIALTVWALVVTLRSNYASRYEKIVLSLMLILLPVVGLAAWTLAWFTRKRSARSHRTRETEPSHD